MKKVLFLLGMYQPRASANGICCEQVIKKLIESGYEVYCVVNAEYYSPEQESYDGVQIHRIKPRLTYRINEWCEYNRGTKLSIMLSSISGLMSKFKNILSAPFWPLVSPLYTYRFYNKAKKLHKGHTFDAVVSVYTPRDSLIAGHLLKRKFPELKYIPYFLDSLSGGWGPRYFSPKYIIKRGQKWEKRLLQNADIIVAMKSSEEHHKKYNSNSKYFNKIKFLDIPLMAEQKYQPTKVSLLDKSKINIVYIGSIPYPIRNPQYILSIFEKLNQEDVVITFVGRNNCENMFLKTQQRLGNRLKIIDNVPHQTAITIAHEADILINIGSTNASMIPCKIFEYMSVGKPIISTYSIDDEPSIPYLEKYPHTLLLDERIVDDKNVLLKLKEFINTNKNSRCKYDLLKKDFYDNTPEAFVKMLDRLL